MRIAYVCLDRGVPVLGQTGSSIHVREFIRALVERGHAVTLLAAATGDRAGTVRPPCRLIDLATDPTLDDLRARIAKRLRLEENTSSRAAEIYNLLLNQTLLQELRRLPEDVDLVYERQSLWSIAGLQLARERGLPFVLEVNAPLTEQQEMYRVLDLVEVGRAVEDLVLAGADRVLVTTPALGDYVHARGVSRQRVRLFPCGVSRALFPPDGRVGCRAVQEFTVGFLGSLKPWHGVELLLDAFLELASRSGRYRLLIIGDGPLRPVVESFVQSHHLDDRVTLAGAVAHERVGEYLAQVDAGVAPYPPLPSFYFSPLKVWEYAAAGVPIVASASGDLPRQFPHKSAALLHPPGNVRKIVKHIELLAESPDLGGRLARRARRVARLHTWDRLAARFETLAARLARPR